MMIQLILKVLMIELMMPMTMTMMLCSIDTVSNDAADNTSDKTTNGGAEIMLMIKDATI